MKQNLTIAALALAASLLLFGCKGSEPDPTPPVVPPTPPVEQAVTFANPLENLGAPANDLISAEKARGNAATYDEAKRQISVQVKDTKVAQTIDYYLDEAGNYRYAATNVTMKSEADLLKALEAMKYKAEASLSVNPDVVVYLNASTGFSYSLNKKASEKGVYRLIYLKSDQDAFSWGRMTMLDKEPFGIPLLAKGVTVELMEFFEARLGHTLDTDRSKPDKGVYVYKTGDAKRPAVRYWFDVKTKMYLEEASVEFTPEAFPEQAVCTEYLKKFGFAPTIAVDQQLNHILYNKERTLCVGLYIKPEKGKEADFIPEVHFYYAPLKEDLIIPEKVDFPFPIDDWQLTGTEVIAQYKKKPYFVSMMTDPQMGIPVITTNSKDFEKITLLIFDEDYIGVTMVAKNLATVYSPSIVKALEDAGYVYSKEKSVSLPSYVNEAKHSLCQLDVMAVGGFFGVAFSDLNAE
ncbi:hypothetical protein Tsumi_02090 [Porphyromonas miyakawae]|uniref:Lipoprotein n=1 Tax=Porphyromonas miyakawae TaxID=3137470 RepID=A0ABQ0E059_9PORP